MMQNSAVGYYQKSEIRLFCRAVLKNGIQTIMEILFITPEMMLLVVLNFRTVFAEVVNIEYNGNIMVSILMKHLLHCYQK